MREDCGARHQLLRQPPGSLRLGAGWLGAASLLGRRVPASFAARVSTSHPFAATASPAHWFFCASCRGAARCKPPAPVSTLLRSSSTNCSSFLPSCCCFCSSSTTFRSSCLRTQASWPLSTPTLTALSGWRWSQVRARPALGATAHGPSLDAAALPWTGLPCQLPNLHSAGSSTNTQQWLLNCDSDHAWLACVDCPASAPPTAASLLVSVCMLCVLPSCSPRLHTLHAAGGEIASTFEDPGSVKLGRCKVCAGR